MSVVVDNDFNGKKGNDGNDDDDDVGGSAGIEFMAGLMRLISKLVASNSLFNSGL